MRSIELIIITTLLLAVLNAKASGYEAHEWGTFTSVVDSTGVTQNGMYHEDEALPQFVHPFGELRAELPPPRPPRPVVPPSRPCNKKICSEDPIFSTNIITQKMETP